MPVFFQFLLAFLLVPLSSAGGFSEASMDSGDEFYRLKATSIDGEEVSFEQFRGKVVLIVNTASRCGFTSQYEGLEELYQKYSERGLVILGFPSNDFLNQEPGTDAEIKKFCSLNYKVTFPLFSKGPVGGPEVQPVYHFLTTDSHVGGKVRWNFEKFLIDRRGIPRERYRSFSGPSGKKIVQRIEALLSESTGNATQQG